MNSLDRTFAALSDDTRRKIIARLAEGETALSEIAAPFEMSQTAVTKHVKVLTDAGLVEVSKRGRTRYCRLQAEPMKYATDWLINYQEFWGDNFQSLAKHLRRT